MWWFYLPLGAFALFLLGRIDSLVNKVITRIDTIEERFQYDWTQMSAELRISAFKRGGGLLCRAEQRFSALAAAISMPVTGDWFIFEGSDNKTYRGEVVGREIRYTEVPSQRSPQDARSTRLHMIVRIDVVCDDEEGWLDDPLADQMRKITV